MGALSAEKVLDVLGNEVRRAILKMLEQRPMSVGELASGLPVSRPAVSKHLQQLQEVHLVRHQSQGTKNIFCLDQRGFLEVLAWLQLFSHTPSSLSSMDGELQVQYAPRLQMVQPLPFACISTAKEARRSQRKQAHILQEEEY